MKFLSTYLLISVCFIFSCQTCQNSSEITDDVEVSDEYILLSKHNMSNAVDLDEFRRNLENIEVTAYSPDSDGDGVPMGFEDLVRAHNELGSLEFPKVSVVETVGSLFDPDLSGCPLPKKVKNKLKRLKDNKKRWAPKEVTAFVQSLPDSAIHLPRSSVSVLAHTIKVKSSDGVRDWTVFGAPTFDNLAMDQFILKNAFNSFIYSLDCSGYMSAALAGSGTAVVGNMNANAEMALKEQRSLFIAGGVLVSPLAAAYHGNGLGVDMSPEDRIAILQSMVEIPGTSDSDEIIVANTFEAIWMSKEGDSSFNGKASYKGSIGAGFGVASISAGSEAGGTLSRQSSYTSFETYYTSRKVIPDLKPFSIADVKALIQTLTDDQLASE